MNRKQLGEHLRNKREKAGIIKQALVNQGLRFERIQDVEKGSANYTIDTLLLYVEAIGGSIRIE